MEDKWWLDDVPITDDISAILTANEVRHAAVVCFPVVANVVSHCLFENDWRQGTGQRMDESVVFQLNHSGVRALDDLGAHPLAAYIADGSVRIVREQIKLESQSKKQKVVQEKKQDGKKDGFSFVELFAGIGGFRVACEALGGHCVFAVELNQEARQTYSANFSEVCFASDVRGVDVASVPRHDLLTAGFPCQSFTSAGEAKGFDDPRGQLFFQVVRVLQGAKPPFFVLENVPHLLEVDGGRAVLVATAALQRLGYRVAHRVVHGASLLAQDRKRLFIVGALPEHAERRRFVWPDDSKDLGFTWKDIRDANDNDGPRLTAEQAAAMRNIPLVKADGKLRTLMASYKRSHRLHSQFVPLREGGGYRFFSPRECARAQGFGAFFKLDACNNQNSV